MTKQEIKLMGLLMSGDKGSIHQALSLMDALGMETQEENDSLVSQVTEYLYNNASHENDYRDRTKTLRKELVRFKGGVYKELVDSVDSVIDSLWPNNKKPTGSVIHGKQTQTLDFMYLIEGDYGPDSYQFGLAYTFTGNLKKSLKQKGLIQKDDQVYPYYDEDYFRFDITFELDQINFNKLKLASTRSDTMRKLTKRQASRKLARGGLVEPKNAESRNKTSNYEMMTEEAKTIEKMLKKYGEVKTFFPRSGRYQGSINIDLSVPEYELSISIYITPEGYVAEVSDLGGYYQETFKGTPHNVDALVRKSIDLARQSVEDDYRKDNFMDAWDDDEDYGYRQASRKLDELYSQLTNNRRRARFHEGPEGTKEFEEWKAEQPEEFQEEWDANTEKYKDKFKQANLTRRQASRALDRLHAQVVGTKRTAARSIENDLEDLYEFLNEYDGLTAGGKKDFRYFLEGMFDNMEQPEEMAIIIYQYIAPLSKGIAKQLNALNAWLSN